MPDLTPTANPDQEHVGSHVAEPPSSVAWFLWLAATLGLLTFIVLARIPTHLGVEAPSWDKGGRDLVWRIWWRARDQMIDVGPQWLFNLVFFGLVILFVLLAVAALWIVLVPGDPESDSKFSAK